ncbi:MAG: flagellar hook-length control protein FliK [Alphaproteobacteria bacterium]
MQAQSIELFAPQPAVRRGGAEAAERPADGFDRALSRAQRRPGDDDTLTASVATTPYTDPAQPVRQRAMPATEAGNAVAPDGEPSAMAPSRPSVALPAATMAPGAKAMPPAADVAPGTVAGMPTPPADAAGAGTTATARPALPGTLTQATTPVQVALAGAALAPVLPSEPSLQTAEPPIAATRPSAKTAQTAPQAAGETRGGQAGALQGRGQAGSGYGPSTGTSNGMATLRTDPTPPQPASAATAAPLVGAAADGTLALAGGATPDDGILAAGLAGERADAATRIGAQVATARAPAPPPQVPGEQVSIHIQNAVRSGADRIHVRLHPAELGRVEVKLDIGHDRAVTAIVTTERAEAADLLARDARILQRALEEAGLRADTGSLTFRHSGDGTGNGGRHEPAAMTHAAADESDATDAGGPPPSTASARPHHDGLVDLDA